MSELLNLSEFYYETDEDNWSPFPEASILINPDDRSLRNFLGSEGTGAVAITKAGNMIFFNIPECADNDPQLDFTEYRFTICNYRLYGRFEEKLTVSSKEEMISLDQAITTIVDKYSCLRPPKIYGYTWVQFYQLAEKIFNDPDWVIKYSNLDYPFLSLEDMGHYEEVELLIGLLEAKEQDLEAINQAIVEKMKDVRTPYDEIKTVIVGNRIEALELKNNKTGRYLFRYVTTRGYKAGIVLTDLPLCCLTQEPNGARIKREIDSCIQAQMKALHKEKDNG